MHSFDTAIKLTNHGTLDGPTARFSASVIKGWDIRGIPHGGYLSSLVAAAACSVVEHSDPVSISANFLAPPAFGPAEVHTEILRSGKRQSTVTARLIQDGVERVHAVVIVGTVADDEPTQWGTDISAPTIAAPDECIVLGDRRLPDGEELALHQHLDLRLVPDVGWLDEKPSGVPRLDGWMRYVDGRAPDPLALLMFSDGLPPSLFEALGNEIGHVPTVQLTTHLFSRPAPGWIQARCTTRANGGGFVNEDGELWDENGRLVATTRQLALLR
ncbi:MAG: acyl-coenzyme A thioesterase PaaI-like protein [Acidimicrobiales bacterium]